MQHGRLVESGEAEAVCTFPKEAYTRQLLAATPELPASADGLPGAV
jgi:peptide/nickel transport system ATP-binding protein